jgi:hypothetical protein
MNEALVAQKDRATRLQHHLRRLGYRFYDPPEALLKQWNEFFPRFTGYTVAQNSLEYALLLLASDDRVYGIDDAIEANRIIRRILEHQVMDTDSERFGNFLWMTHWDRVKDRNAVSFLAPGLVHTYVAFGEKLEDETKAALEQAFEPMLAGIYGHGAAWSYTNIWALNLGAMVALSRVLDDEEAHDRAEASFGEWIEHTGDGGMHEFNSPCYTPVTLSGIEHAWAHTPDDQFRARLERALDYLSYQLAANIFPTGFVAGAASRSYLRDLIRGNGNGMYWAHVKLGTPLREFPEAEQHQAYLISVNYTLHDYVPPPAAREMATGHREDLILDRTLPLNSRRTHVMRPHWSLASQTVPRARGHSPSPYLLLVSDTDAERASVVIAPDETFTHRPGAGFDSAQARGRLLGRLHCEPTDEERAKAAEDPEYICEPRVLFGRRDAINQVRVGNVDWGGAPVDVAPGQSIAVAYEQVTVGLIALPLGAEGEPVDGRTRLAFGDDDELRLNLLMFGGDAEPVDVLVLMDALGAGGDLRAYAEWLGGWELTREGAGEHPTLTATHPHEDALNWPMEDDPLGEALHRSSALTVMPGDLQAWIDGGAGMAVLAQD